MSDALEELKSVIVFLYDQLQDMPVPTGRRELIVLGCMDLAIEHAQSVGVLIEQEISGSAFALLRPIFDSYVRGVWSAIHATDEQLTLFENGRLSKTVHFRNMVEDIEKTLVSSEVLSSLRKTGWKLMSDFTHTGYDHVTRRFSRLHLGANYPPEEIEQALTIAASFSLLAANFTADVAKNRPVVDSVMKRARKFAATRLS